MESSSHSELTHAPVMPAQVLEGLCVNENGIYVDGTFGRGGHSKLLLQKLSAKGRLFAFDRDSQAISSGAALKLEYPQLEIVHSAFSKIANSLELRDLLGQVDGVLLDLGVSSPQLDSADRGFSFRQDGGLDMRMDRSAGQTAGEWLAQTSEKELRRVLESLGEEPFSARIARAIVESRGAVPLKTTAQLAELIEKVVPAAFRAKSKIHVATRSFQAIRMQINDELGELERFLSSCLDLLKPGGRLAIISFHSLEDRMVKRFIRDAARGRETLTGIPLTEQQMGRTLKSIGGAQKAGSTEVADNPRSRSAILRVAEKL